jgi:hypothetical protein
MGGGMMLVLQIEGYSKQALATLIAMLGRIEIALANAVLHRATTMKTSLTAAAVIATLTLATAHAETVIPDTVIPHIADVSHAETATADFFYRFFTAKSQKNLKKTMSFFSRDLKTYTDATLGWGLDGFDAVNGIFAKYMPTWPEASMSYPTKILGGNGSVLVQFTDTPELFGGELRIFGAIDIVDGKIVRWVDYWDASSFDKALYQQIKTPADHFPYDYAEKVVGEHASPKIQDVAKRLNAALNSPNPGDAASLFASDGVLEDAALRIQVLGKAAIGRYFSRAAHDIPYGLGSKPRHVVGNDQGGGLEWIADPKKGVRVGVSALTLNSAGLIEKMTSVYDTRLLDKAAVSKLVDFVSEP